MHSPKLMHNYLELSAMNLTAVWQALLLLLLLTALALAAALLAGVQTLTAPQLITASALWILPGLYAARRAGESGAFYGLITGVIGGALLWLLLTLLAGYGEQPLLRLLGERALVLMILAGFWSVTGGMLGQTAQAIKQRRAARKAARQANHSS